MKKYVMLFGVVFLTGCGNPSVIRFSDPNNDQVELIGTLFDVSPEKYRSHTDTNSASDGVPWGYNTNHVVTKSEFGTGDKNTYNIIHSQGGDPRNTHPNVADPVPYAAWVCQQLVVDKPKSDEDYTEWYLPSIEELKGLYNAMEDAKVNNTPLFPRSNSEYWNGMFWSSTEANRQDSALFINFHETTLQANETLKTEDAKVRCVHKL